MKILNKCKKCGEEVIKEQKFIVMCCGQEMERKRIDEDNKT